MRSGPFSMFSLLLVGLSTFTFAPGEASALDIEEAADRFGTFPTMRRARLSPDGQRIVFFVHHKEDFPIAMVADLRGGKPNLIAASDPKLNMDLSWCDWANDSRILCGYAGVRRSGHYRVPLSRLIAVNDDGSNMIVLLQSQQKDQYGVQFLQDGVIDWLPNDRNHILMQFGERTGEGVVRININNNKTRSLERVAADVWDWRSNNRGKVLVRRESGKRRDTWVYRSTEEGDWKTLREIKHEDVEDIYYPAGFGDDENELLVFDDHEGRQALFSVDLAENAKQSLVYAHPSVDLHGNVRRLGRHKRVVGVDFSTDVPRVKYFDPTVAAVHNAALAQLPGRLIWVQGESWDRRFYLILAQTDVEPGTYYRLDTKQKKLVRIAETAPKLADIEHSDMKPIEYPARDGTPIPAFLSLPDSGSDGTGPFPTIVMPHGGPYDRDEWGFDLFTQFLTNQGYAVLQSNYRGSYGYGKAWRGKGAFQEWERATSDIEDGIRHLVELGVADPERICAVGFHYGGYAAMISGIVNPNRYKCLASIAGISDPILILDQEGFTVNRREARGLLGSDRGLLAKGSPVKRAEEVQAPILILHGEHEVFPGSKHSEVLNRALDSAGKDVSYIEYEDVVHPYSKQASRIDMFEQVGRFLAKHLRTKAAAAAVQR